MTQQSDAQSGIELHEARQTISTLKAQLASSERRNGYLESEKKALEKVSDRQRSELEDLSLSLDPKAASEHYWQCADAIEPYVRDGALSDSVVESMEFLLEFWIAAGKPESLNARKAQWQVEAIGRVLAEVTYAVEAETARAHLRNAMRRIHRQAERGA